MPDSNAFTPSIAIRMFFMQWGWLLEAPLVRGSLAVAQAVVVAVCLAHDAIR
jgi:hypothetical protein